MSFPDLPLLPVLEGRVEGDTVRFRVERPGAVYRISARFTDTQMQGVKANWKEISFPPPGADKRL